MAKKKQVVEQVIRYCKDCAHSVEDTKFENLSLDGKPTLLSCPYQEWRMVISTTETCDHYTERVVEMKSQSESSGKADDWLDW